MNLIRMFLVLLLVSPGMALGGIQVYEFESAEQQQRFDDITADLRCPKCQNQNIAASDAPIAKDMRDQVYQRIRNGESDQQIIDAMIERFGDFVYYRPPLTAATLFLWFGPLVLALIGVMIIVNIVRGNRRGAGPGLSAEERARVDALIHNSDTRLISDSSHADPAKPGSGTSS